MAARLRLRAGAAQRQGELIVRLRIVGREPDGLAELRDRAGVSPAFSFSQPDADRKRRGLRVRLQPVQPLGFGQRGVGGRLLTGDEERLTETEVRLRRCGIQWIAARNSVIALSSAPCCFRTVPSM